MVRSLIAFTFVASAVASQAVIIDFENLPNSDPFFTLHGDQVESGGYRFNSTMNVGQPDPIATWGPQMSLYTGSTAIFANYFNDDLVMTQIGGGAFDVTSIDLADVLLVPTSYVVTFTGTRADSSTVISSVTLLNGQVLDTFAVTGMTNIISMKIDDGVDTSVQIDNIVANPVAEPGTLAVAAFGAAALLRRRRKS